MYIAGFKESSLNEWEGHVSSVIWTAGCNWRCTYCHAKHIITDIDNIEKIDEQVVFDYINDRSEWIDGLCITGGEPTLQTDIVDFAKRVKETLNIGIKLETNGSNPEVIRYLIDNELIDCLALDFKTPIGPQLLSLNGQQGGIYEVLESFNISFKAPIDVEYHTTLCPVYINKQTIQEMGTFLHNKGTWILQQYNSDNVLNIDIAGSKEFVEEEITEVLKDCRQLHSNVILKNFNLSEDKE